MFVQKMVVRAEENEQMECIRCKWDGVMIFHQCETFDDADNTVCNRWFV